jgi:hypothetical protein
MRLQSTLTCTESCISSHIHENACIRICAVCVSRVIICVCMCSKEMGVVHVADPTAAPCVIVQDERLGIATFCLKHLYVHAQTHLHKAETPNEHASLTRAMLLVKGDVTVAWNIRCATPHSKHSRSPHPTKKEVTAARVACACTRAQLPRHAFHQTSKVSKCLGPQVCARGH